VNNSRASNLRKTPGKRLITEFLILSDGTVLVQNLTPTTAAILSQLNPNDDTILRRVVASRPAKESSSLNHELRD
jgi:hypothetical protein